MFRITIFSVALLLSSKAYSQNLTFHDCVERLAENRSKVISYVANAKMVNYRTETIGDISYQSTVTNQYECVADRTADCVLIVRSASSASLRDVDLRHGILLKRGGEFFFSGGTSLQPRSRQLAEGFLDPTVVGLGLCAELLLFFEDSEVVNNYRQWQSRSWPAREQDGPLYSFGPRQRGDRKASLAVFNSQQGFSISELRMAAGSGAAFQCKYKQIDGHWMPTSALYKCSGDGGIVVEIDWIQVNKPINRQVFDPQWITSQTGLKLAAGASQ